MQMRKSLKAMFFPLIATVLLTAGCSGKTGDSSSTSAPLPEVSSRPKAEPAAWTPDAAKLTELADRKEIPQNPGCSIQPPKGYEQQPFQGRPGVPLTGARWNSPRRSDGTQTQLLVVIGRRPPAEKPAPLDQFAIDFLKSREQHVGPLQKQPIEYGTINGLPVGRVRWSAEHPVTKRKTHGFVYVATPGQLDIMIDSQDIEPYQASTLPLAEAAALTFRYGESQPAAQPPAAGTGRQPEKRFSLAEARRGFKTKLIRQETAKEPVPEPPPNLFRIIRYDSAAGKLAAYLSPDPQDGKKHPAIIWITGGDCNTIGAVWEPAPPSNDQTARAFREAGILMMFPSLRGGNDNPGFKEGFFGEVDDVLAAADYLGKQGFVDAQRIYLGGHSTGGTLVFLAAACSDRFRAVFSFGPTDQVADYGPEYLPFDTSDRRELELRSPIRWLSSVQVPTFVFEGTVEGNLPSLQAMARVSTSAKIRFHPVRGVNHFSILAPLTRLLAAKILRDEGPTTNIAFTPNELNNPLAAAAGKQASNAPPTNPPPANPPPANLPKAPEGWKYTTAKDGSYAFLFPDKTTRSGSREQTSKRGGLSVKAQINTCELADGTALLISAERLSGPALKGLKIGDVYNSVVEGLTEKGYSVSEPKEFLIGKQKGREYILTKDQIVQRKVLLVLRDARTFDLTVVAGDKDKVMSPTADTFLKSLVLIPKTPPSKDGGK
jgi:acetyl esterase/lipase